MRGRTPAAASSESNISTSAVAPPPPPVAGTKRKRADRSVKVKRRKLTKQITVKCALRGILRSGADVRRVMDIVARIRERVAAYSRRAVNACLTLSGIVKDLFCREPQPSGSESTPREEEDASWIADVPVPGELFTQTFFRQLLLGTDSANIPDPTIKRYHERHPQLVLQGYRHLGDRNIYSAGATQNLTNLKNALRTELDDRIKTATRRMELSPGEARIVRYCINGWKLPADFGYCFPMSEVAGNAVTDHRRVLGMAAGAQISEEWLADDANLPALLRYSVFLNKIYQDADKKLFNVVPICGIRSHFIRIDTSVLYGILRDAGVIGGHQVPFAAFDVFWADTFDLRRIRPRDAEFGGSVMTDGVSLCSTFEKTTEADAGGDATAATRTSAEYAPAVGDIVVGCDPGRTNIYYMVGVHEEMTKVVKLTRRQYYTESGCITARRDAERWTRRIKDHLDAMSEVSTKGIRCEAHEDYLVQFQLYSAALWDEYTRPRWARQRLALYGGKKRVFASFFNRLVATFPGGRLVVAFGNAKFSTGGVGEQSAPTTRAYKECASRVCTYSTDEFRTSKVHYRDDSVLQLVSSRTRPGVALRGLLFNPQLQMFVSRDNNAALNIRRILIDATRPDMLNRNGGGIRRLQQAIVKRILGR